MKFGELSNSQRCFVCELHSECIAFDYENENENGIETEVLLHKNDIITTIISLCQHTYVNRILIANDINGCGFGS